MKNQIPSLQFKHSALAAFDNTNETLWWSRRPVPKHHIRLRTGEPVSDAMFKAILANILLALMVLEPEHPYSKRPANPS